MAFFDILKQKSILVGSIAIRGLPPHKMYSVSIALFQVSDASSPPPFGGKLTVDKYSDEVSVKKAEAPEDMPLQFQIRRAVGFYYLDVGVIAYLERRGKMFAQVERFLPMPAPCEIKADGHNQVDLVVDWPTIPFKELGDYGTVRPAGNQ